MQRSDGLGRLRPDLVLERHGTDHDAIGDDVKDGLAFPRPRVRLRECFQPELVEEPRSAHDHLPSLDHGLRAAAGQRLERHRRVRHDPALLRAVHDRPRERVL